MKITATTAFAALPFAFVLLSGCTDGGAAMFRKDSSSDMGALLSETVSIQESNVRETGVHETGVHETGAHKTIAHQTNVRESNVNESAAVRQTGTLVSTASATMPRRPSLVTLGFGDDLATTINNAGGPVLLDFYADWCGPCKTQGQILHDLEQEAANNGTLMIKINIDDHPELADQLQVEGIPTLMMVKEGRIVNRKSGVADKRQLIQWMR